MRGLAAALLLAAGSVAAAIWLLGGGSDTTAQPASTAAPGAPLHPAHSRKQEAEPRHARSEHPRPQGQDESPLRAGAAASWAELARSTPARLGIAVLPLGAGARQAFGSLRSGHAWSTIKVPILVTLMREGRLDAEEEGWARAALTASDNEAAAALFARLEAAHGGLHGASTAVEATLRRAGDRATVVATAPPPPGAISTFGQTEWSVEASATFFRSLAAGCLLDSSGTAYVLGLMEEVVPEQRWGLGKAIFPKRWRVGFKGGWGPEGSASGPYLVRQSGVLLDAGAGVAVAIVARPESGSFDAGVEALDRVSAWLANELNPGAGSQAHC